MSNEPTGFDLTLRLGLPLTRTYQLFTDPRAERWRERYKDELIYWPGDAVRASDGTTWLSLVRSQAVDPLTGGQTAWAVLTPMDLTGWTALATFEGIGAWEGFTVVPTLDAPNGKLTIAVSIAAHAEAPRESSARWYVRLADPSSVPSSPIGGTASYVNP